MHTASVTLSELAQHGAGELAPYLGRQRPPESAVEWLGIAVGKVPDLAARARTADEVNWRPGAAAGSTVYGPLLDALTDAIAGAVALGKTALDVHLERYPRDADDGPVEAEIEEYAALLGSAHRTAPRRAEFLIGGFASFLGGAIEAAGALAEAELSTARARRWDRADPARLVSQRASQVQSALVNALGGLLAYARLTAEKRPPPG